MPDYLDTDSDNDGIPDSREGRADSNHNGTPDALEAPGKLQTAVRGVGAFEPLTLFGLLGVIGWTAVRRTRRPAVARVLPALLCTLFGLSAFDAHAKEPPMKGFFLGVDAGASRVQPRNPDGGYRVDDSTDLGYRIDFGYAFSRSWAAELFYADGGSAGISSANPSVGHLGEISYQMTGVGVEWAPLEGGRQSRWYPLVKAGAVQIRNHASSPTIQYERLNDLGVYLGGGLGLRLGKTWMAQGEVVSYDQDELFFTFGVRKAF